MTESNLVKPSRKAKVELSARPFFEIGESEPKAKEEPSEKNFLKQRGLRMDVAIAGARERGAIDKRLPVVKKR